MRLKKKVKFSFEKKGFYKGTKHKKGKKMTDQEKLEGFRKDMEAAMKKWGVGLQPQLNVQAIIIPEPKSEIVNAEVVKP